MEQQTTSQDRPVDQDEAARAAAHHARVLEGLEALTDYLADAGPGSTILDPGTTLSIMQGLREPHYGPAPERIRRLAELADGTEISRNACSDGTVHYNATLEFADGAVNVRTYTIVDADEVDAADAALAEATEPIIREMWEAAVTPPPADAPEIAPDPGLVVNYWVEHAAGGFADVRDAFAEHGITAREGSGRTVTDKVAADIYPLTDEHGLWGVRVIPPGPDMPLDTTFPPPVSYPTVGDYVGALARRLKLENPENHDHVGLCNHTAETAVRGIHADGRVRTVCAAAAHLERVRLEMAAMGFVTVELTGRDWEFDLCDENPPACGETAEEVLGL